jgi:hypothetical protein
MIEKEIEYIQAIRNKLLKFDVDFFYKKKKDNAINEFKKKYYLILSLLNKFTLLLKRKNENLLLEVIERIKNEYIEYKYLKSNLNKVLLKYKIKKKQVRALYYNRFGHENNGSILSVSKENKNKK